MRFAIVGAAVELPDVSELDELHEDLLRGRQHFERLTADEVSTARRRGADVEDPRYVPVVSSLPTAGAFDAEFFGMTRADALWTDPQQRLLLTLTHRALESAGIDSPGAVFGSYTATSPSTYLDGRVGRGDAAPVESTDYRALIGNDRDFVSSRLAYRFGFTGPALTVQSACSSSLVALHQACLGLAFGDVDVAVVGAASLAFPDRIGYRCVDGGITSPTGRSRPFDRESDGTIRGSGGGVVLVRRLDDALADRDVILGVIAGTSVNNDGGQGMSYTAPTVEGQERVLSRALARAGVDPAAVGYIETHGTGTPIGDPIEFRALRRAYDRAPSAPPCRLGSAKANYGHLDVAAGMIGLLKTMSVLRGRTIYPQPGFAAPNPAVALDGSRFDIPRDAVPTDSPYAAVSSFGMGGTNAHVVLQAPPADEPTGDGRAVRVCASARTAEGLREYRDRLARHLKAHPSVSVHDVAATLAVRTRHQHTWEATVSTSGELVDLLTSASQRTDAAPGSVVNGGRRIWLPVAALDDEVLLLPYLEHEDVSAPGVRPSAAAEPGDADVAALFVALVGEELGCTVDADSDFFALGGESMALVAVVGKLAEARGFRPDFAALDGLARVGDLAAVLADQAAAPRSDAVTRPGPARTGILRIGKGEPAAYLYPPAGGTNYCYLALQKSAPMLSLGAFRAVRPGDSIDSIAEACIDALHREGRLRDGMILGGYSFGGNVAVEMCRRLEARGVAVGGVLLIDSFAPCAFGVDSADGDDGADSADRADAERLGDEVTTILDEATVSLPGYSPEQDVDARGDAVRDFFGALWHENTAALRKHRPEQPLDAPLTLLRARTPLSDDRAAALSIDIARTGEWGRYTRGRLTVTDVPGDHYTLFTSRANRAVVAATVVRTLQSMTSGRDDA